MKIKQFKDKVRISFPIKKVRKVDKVLKKKILIKLAKKNLNKF